MTTPLQPASYNPYPFPKRKAKDAGAALDVPLTNSESDQKKACRALEQIQASRPLKPPGVVR